MPSLFLKGQVKVGDHVQLVATNTWPSKTAFELKCFMSCLKYHMGTVIEVQENDMVVLRWDRMDAQIFYETECNASPIKATKDLKAVSKIDTMGEYSDIEFVVKACPNCGRRSMFYDDSGMSDRFAVHYRCRQCEHEYTSNDLDMLFGLYGEKHLEWRKNRANEAT